MVQGLSASNLEPEFERVTFILGLEVVLFALNRDLVPHYDWAGLLNARGDHGITYVDAVVVGEREISIVELLANWSDRHSRYVTILMHLST